MFLNATTTTEFYNLSLHDALPISHGQHDGAPLCALWCQRHQRRSEEHTSELQSREKLVCRLLLEKKNLKQKKPGRPIYISPLLKDTEIYSPARNALSTDDQSGLSE